MPMIDASIPAGALAAEAERRLFGELAEIWIRLEGFDPSSVAAREATWLFLTRPAVFVAGTPADRPRYPFVVSVPEGQYDDERRAAVVREMTAAVARAEGNDPSDVSARVWIFPLEVPHGCWGGRGAVRRLPDIFASLIGEQARADAVARLAARRRGDPGDPS